MCLVTGRNSEKSIAIHDTEMASARECEVKDWNQVRDNKNGLYKVIENLELDLTHGDDKTKVRTLRKIETSLGGEGYFPSKFVHSQLVAKVVDLLKEERVEDESKHGMTIGELAARVLQNGSKNRTVLDKLASDHFDAIVNRLCISPNENLYVIIERMCRSPKWVRKAAGCDQLVTHLARSDVAKYEILETMPGEAINKNFVTHCMNELRKVDLDELNVAHSLPMCLRCLLAMSFYPKGRLHAIQQGATGTMMTLLKVHPPPAIAAPGVGFLTNLLQDPKHDAKKQAMELHAPDTLNALLNSVTHDPHHKLDKLQVDLILACLQAISVICSYPPARKHVKAHHTHCLQILAKHSLPLIARTAKNTIQVIEWIP